MCDYGQYYNERDRIMNIQLLKGDCLELMKQIPDKSVDLILCDIPYGSTQNPWDIIIPFDKMWNSYNRIVKQNGNIVLFSSGNFTLDLIQSNIKNFRYRLIWNKNVPTGMTSAKFRPMKYFEEISIFKSIDNKSIEEIVYNPQPKKREGKHPECYRYNHYAGKSNHTKVDKVEYQYDPDFVQPSDVLDFDVVPNRNGKIHPTQKPLELIDFLVLTYSNEGNIVLDNCMGSGTTGEASVNLKRDFIGIELDEKYFNLAKERIDYAASACMNLGEKVQSTSNSEIKQSDDMIDADSFDF